MRPGPLAGGSHGHNQLAAEGLLSCWSVFWAEVAWGGGSWISRAFLGISVLLWSLHLVSGWWLHSSQTSFMEAWNAKGTCPLKDRARKKPLLPSLTWLQMSQHNFCCFYSSNQALSPPRFKGRNVDWREAWQRSCWNHHTALNSHKGVTVKD